MNFLKLTISLLVIVAITLTSCVKHNKFSGKFSDEYGNTFELRDDYTATIQLKDSLPVETVWSDGGDPDAVFATIELNGNPAHFFLRDKALYRSREYMIKGKMGSKVKYE